MNLHLARGARLRFFDDPQAYLLAVRRSIVAEPDMPIRNVRLHTVAVARITATPFVTRNVIGLDEQACVPAEP